MLTSAAKTSSHHTLVPRGFSLIEILVALLLVSLMFTLIPSSENSRRHQEVQRAVDDLDRAVRFASNESVLRGSITRLRIDMEKDPMEYVVEYGPKGDMIVPAAPDEKNLSEDELKKVKEKIGKIDAQFTKVEEFQDLTREFSVEVKFVGMATAWSKKLQKSGQASAYFYPTGERDGALFFLATQDELAILEIQPFQDKTSADYVPFPVLPEETETSDQRVARIEQFQETKMEEFYKSWLEQ